MLIAISIHQGDVGSAIRLFKWIQKLSTKLEGHDCLIVADPDTPFDRIVELKTIANEVFDEAMAKANKALDEASAEARKVRDKAMKND